MKAVAPLVLVVVAACYRPTPFDPCSLRCDRQIGCPDNYLCGSNGRCHAANASECPSATTDAGDDIDATGDAIGDGSTLVDAAPGCYGQGILVICPTEPFPGAANPAGLLGTDDNPQCTEVYNDGVRDHCVVMGTTIEVASLLRPVGGRALVLLASDSIVVLTGGEIDASRGGAGADPPQCQFVDGENQVTEQVGRAGGGAGGSFATRGGAGGIGENSPRSPAPAVGLAARGGCSGGSGGYSNSLTGRGLGGPAGGMVYLIAGNRIEVNGRILAGGGGGGGATTSNAGGGGGGSGGLVVLDAPIVTLPANGTIIARGGGGGGGSKGGSAASGGDATTDGTPAPGGSGDVSGTGNGGDGSPGIGGPDSMTGGTGLAGGSGGGGGGDGFIKIYGSSVSLQGLTAPLPTQ